MKLSNIVTVIILAISSTLTPQAMADKLIPETDAELLVWSDATSVEYMKYAAKEFNKDFGYKVKFTFRNIAPMDAASRIMQDGGTTRVADVAEIEHDTLGRLVGLWRTWSPLIGLRKHLFQVQYRQLHIITSAMVFL